MNKTSWHFPRLSLAKQVVGMFESGLSSALVFFAPRRMGKTEFLLRDIMPTAEKGGWLAFYHSFLDASNDAEIEFTKALQQYLLDHSLLSKSKQSISRVKKIGIIEFDTNTQDDNYRDILTKLSKRHKIILLLDEIQALTKDESNLPFVTALRTVLDVNKENIKVIFTGSSREGLKKMFSAKEAPFFYFGQNLSFPQFGPEFTEHLAKKYTQLTQKQLDKTTLWEAFEALGKMPQLIRALVERIVLHPELSINDAKNELLEELRNDRSFETSWENYSSLEQLILLEVASGNQKFYSHEIRGKLASKLGLPDIPVSTIQSTLRKLNKSSVIGTLPERGEYFIDDPNFQDWILKR